MADILDLDNKALQSLDLIALNNGINPYDANDNSVKQAYAFGHDYFVEMVRSRTMFTGGRVLDLLSGYGRWLPFLAKFNKEVIAIERLQACQDLARKLCMYFETNNVELRTGDISLIEKIEDESIDYVWMWSGLQYVDRSYALSQINRVLRPDGKLFVGAYNGPGIMLEHVWKGVRTKKLFEGPSAWALSALALGPDNDGNPNFSDLSSCELTCEKYGFELMSVAPQKFLDLRTPNASFNKIEGTLYEGYVRTIEFVAKKNHTLCKNQKILPGIHALNSLNLSWIKKIKP